MKSVNKEILGFNVPIAGVAETSAELVSACGSDERAVELANNYILYHVHFSKVRSKIVAKLEELTGVKREGQEEGEGEDKKFVVTEKDQEYIGRLEEQLGEAGLKAHEGVIAAMVGAMNVDYTQSARGSGVAAAPAKKWLAYYDALVEKGKLQDFIAKHSIATEGLTDEAIKLSVVNKVKTLVTEATRAALAAAV